MSDRARKVLPRSHTLRREEVPAISHHMLLLAERKGDHAVDAFGRKYAPEAARQMGVRHAVWVPGLMLWRAAT